MKFCNTCGTSNADDALHCQNCGAALEVVINQPAPQSQQYGRPPGQSIGDLGFFTTLFDFSFSSFITSKVIKFVYAVQMLLIALGCLLFIITGFEIDTGWGILFIVLSPIIFLILLVYTRICLELIMVFFRMAEHLRDIKNQDRE